MKLKKKKTDLKKAKCYWVYCLFGSMVFVPFQSVFLLGNASK